MNLTRHSLAQLINAILVLTSSFMFYKGLSVVANTESPVVVVLSGSMEPAFERGDVLFLWNREPRVKVGDVVVYNVKHRDIPIVHRVLRTHSSYVYCLFVLSRFCLQFLAAVAHSFVSWGFHPQSRLSSVIRVPAVWIQRLASP